MWVWVEWCGGVWGGSHCYALVEEMLAATSVLRVCSALCCAARAVVG